MRVESITYSLRSKGAIMAIIGRIMSHISDMKGNMEKNYGEGTKVDLDYGKLTILFLCIYIAFQVS